MSLPEESIPKMRSHRRKDLFFCCLGFASQSPPWERVASLFSKQTWNSSSRTGRLDDDRGSRKECEHKIVAARRATHSCELFARRLSESWKDREPPPRE